LLLSLLVAGQLNAQEKPDGSPTSGRTFRPVVRGTQYAVSSMKQEATRAAAQILEAGGNAFDAVVAGQAVLALVNPQGQR
jgi:gamma-glutamyltranspeptidase